MAVGQPSLIERIGSDHLSAGLVLLTVSGLLAARLGGQDPGASWWLAGVLALAALHLLARVLRRPLARGDLPWRLVAGGLLLSLAGAGLQALAGTQGRLDLAEGESTRELPLDALRLELSRGAASAALALELDLSGVHADQVLHTDSQGLGLRLLAAHARARLEPRLVRDPLGRLGIQLTLRRPGWSASTWLLAGDARHERRSLGPVDVELVLLATQDELAARVTPLPTPSSWVLLEHGGHRPPTRIELPAQLGLEVDCGDGLSARVLRLLRRSRVVDGRLEEADDGHVNPAAVLQLHQGERVETHTIFALHPEFDTARGVSADGGLVAGLRLEAPDSVPRPTVAVLAAADGSLRVQALDADGRQAAVPLSGQAHLATLVLDVQLDGVLDGAAVREELLEADAGDAPAVHVELELAGQGERLWLALGARQELSLGGERLELTFRRRTVPLPFELRLAQASVAYHPGTDRPRTFASRWDIQPVDPGRESRTVPVATSVPAEVLGYRLHQLEASAERSVIVVARDPGDVPRALGLLLLLLGTLGLLRLPREARA